MHAQTSAAARPQAQMVKVLSNGAQVVVPRAATTKTAAVPHSYNATQPTQAEPEKRNRLKTTVSFKEVLDDPDTTVDDLEGAAAAAIQARVRGAVERNKTKQIRKQATAMDLFLASKRARGLFPVLDKDGSEEVTLDEWREAFCLMDQNGDGILTRKEWELLQEETTVFDAFPRKYFAQISKKEWDTTFMALDRDGSGRVSVAEWARAKLGAAPKPDKVLAQHSPLEFAPHHTTPKMTYQARVDHALQSHNLEEMLLIFHDIFFQMGSTTFPVERRKCDRLRVRIIGHAQKKMKQLIKDGDMDALSALLDALKEQEPYLRFANSPEVEEAKVLIGKSR